MQRKLPDAILRNWVKGWGRVGRIGGRRGCRTKNEKHLTTFNNYPTSNTQTNAHKHNITDNDDNKNKNKPKSEEAEVKWN